MGALFFGSLYAGYLGWQWRRVREVGAQISELKKQEPAPAADGTAVASPVAAEITKLTEVRLGTTTRRPSQSEM